MSLLTRRSVFRKGMIACLVGAICSAAPAAWAQGTLEKIRHDKVMRVGVLLENAPFGFIDKKGNPAGFNVDVAKLIAERLGKDIKIEIVPTTNQSRIANLVTSGIDLAVATISMLPKRAKVIQFSEPYTVFENIIVGPKSRDIHSVEDLKGLRIGVGQGSTAEADMLKIAPSSANVQTFADRAAALQALKAGQVDVVSDDNMILTVLSQAAGDEYESKFAVSKQWVGAGMRKGEPEMHKAVNAAIDDIRADGELDALHKKWLNRDAPEWPESIPGVPF